MPELFQKVRSNKGTVFAELAILLPVLILFIGAVFEIGRMYYIHNTLEYGAKEAARIGSSIKESVDENFRSRPTISKSEIEHLIINSIKVRGVIEEPGQFKIRYLNHYGNEVTAESDLPFRDDDDDDSEDPSLVKYVEVEITYPGSGPNVNTPIPVVFNPANIFHSRITLMSKAVFRIEGRFDE